MQRVFPSKTTDANEVSVSNDNNEQLPTSDSRSNAEPSSSEVSRPRAEQSILGGSLTDDDEIDHDKTVEIDVLP